MASVRSTMLGEYDPAVFLRNDRVSFALEKFNSFWNDQLWIGNYMLDLVKYVIECSKSKKIPGASLELTISTLHLLMYYGYFSVEDERNTSAIKEAKKKWKAYQYNPTTISNGATDKIIQCALRVFKYPEDYVPSVISNCLSFPQRVRTFSDIEYVSYIGSIHTVSTPASLQLALGNGSIYLSTHPQFTRLDCGDLCVLYRFLKKLLQKSSATTVAHIIDLKFGKALDNVLNEDGRQAESMLLPLLHLFEQLFTAYPSLLTDHIEAFVLEMDKLRRWPLPYGSSANRVLHKLLAELRSKGCSLIYRMRELFPIMDQCLPVFDFAHFEYPATVYCIVQTEPLESSIFTKVLSLKQKAKHEFFAELVEQYPERLNEVGLLAHILRLQVIIFQLSVYHTLTYQELSGFAGLSPEAMFGLYRKVIEMLEAAEEGDSEQAQSLQERVTLEFVVGLDALVTAETSQLTPLLFSFLAQLNNHTPVLPPLSYELLHLTPDQNVTDIDQTHRSILDDSFIGSKNAVPMQEVFAKHLNEASTCFDTPVRLLVAGEDCMVHETLVKYIENVQQHPGVLDLDVRWYVVPLYGLRSTLAEYLYTVDAWYLRHVYSPFFDQPWLPKLSLNVSEKKLKKDPHVRESIRQSIVMNPNQGGLSDQTLPFLMSAELLDDFVLEANNVLNVLVYKLQCWTERRGERGPDLEVPFCLYVDIDAGKSGSRFNSFLCTMEVTQLDLFGKPYAAEERVTKRIHRMRIGNVPRESDPSTPPVPSAEWLELAYIEPEAAEYEEQFLKKIKNKKGKETQANVNVAVATLYTSLHAGAIDITLTGDVRQVKAVVDGEAYGPFNTFHIEPMLLEDGSLFPIKVATFLEVEM